MWIQIVPTQEAMPDLRPLLGKFESLLTSASVSQRAQMLTIHALYNSVMVPELRSPDHEAVYEANKYLFDECRIESMILALLKGREWSWSASDCAQAYEAYAEKKFHKQGMPLPQELDVMLMSYVAEKYRVVGQIDKFRCWSQQALLESAGRPDWQEYIQEVQAEGKEVDLNVLWHPN
jgi:hypothetical protein